MNCETGEHALARYVANAPPEKGNVKQMNKRTILILTIVADLLIAAIAVFMLKEYQQIDPNISVYPSDSELYLNHQQEILSDNPDSLRKHASQLWNRYEYSERVRKTESHVYSFCLKVILWVVGFHFFATIVGLTISSSEPRSVRTG
jgi:hypothetical protein